VNPWWELTKLLFIVTVWLGIGKLPFIDSWSHIGGFVFGWRITLMIILTRRRSGVGGGVRAMDQLRAVGSDTQATDAGSCHSRPCGHDSDRLRLLLQGAEHDVLLVVQAHGLHSRTRPRLTVVSSTELWSCFRSSNSHT